MKDLSIKPTNKTLEVECSPGKIRLDGCSITNDPRVFFKPVQEWVRDYIRTPEQETLIDLKFEYIDTASVKFVYQILQELKAVETGGKKIKVNWYYELDDPEILELGEIIQSKLEFEFEFIELEEE